MTLINRAMLLAAALGVTSLAAAQNMMPPAAPRTTTPPPDGAIRTEAILLPQWPAGFVGRQVQEQAGIYKPISTATEAALTIDGFDDMVERRSEPDQQRIEEDNFAEKDFPELNKVVEQLREKFEQKYAADFNLNDPARVFDTKTQLAQAEVSDPNLARERFPVPAQDSLNQARMASGRIEPDKPDSQDRPEADRPEPREPKSAQAPYLSIGRKVAIISLQGSSQAMPTLNASLAHEGPAAWRIDIPDSVSGPQLYNNLLHHLMVLNNDSANWPTNVNDTKRLFARHVLAAMYDIPARPAAGDQADAPSEPEPPLQERSQP